MQCPCGSLRVVIHTVGHFFLCDNTLHFPFFTLVLQGALAHLSSKWGILMDTEVFSHQYLCGASQWHWPELKEAHLAMWPMLSQCSTSQPCHAPHPHNILKGTKPLLCKWLHVAAAVYPLSSGLIMCFGKKEVINAWVMFIAIFPDSTFHKCLFKYWFKEVYTCCINLEMNRRLYKLLGPFWLLAMGSNEFLWWTSRWHLDLLCVSLNIYKWLQKCAIVMVLKEYFNSG